MARTFLSAFIGIHLRLIACGSLASIAGCGGVEGPVMQRTALDSFDLETMTDQMAESIARDPDIQLAVSREGRLRVVVMPVENMLTGEILPRGRAELFTARLRMLLSNHQRDRFQWQMNRDYFYRLQAMELDGIDLGPEPQRVQPDYALIATFESLQSEDARRRSAYYLCVYQLRDLRDGTVLWTDKYEVKKVAVKGWLD